MTPVANFRSQQARSRIGQVIGGRYEVIDLLGAGGMGAVYHARHRFTEEEVALKVLFPDVAANPEVVRRFIREAQASAKIQHPGVVRVLDAGTTDQDETYIIMELLRGEDLAGALAREEMPAGRLLDIVAELLETLAVAHDRGFVHRDIKAENIFLSTRAGGPPQVKLLDFGIARQIDAGAASLTSTGAMLGTPYYMSPEQARGERVEATSDLWSVGAMMYHALAGQPPFEGSTVHVLVAAILTAEPTPLAARRADLPAEVLAVVDRALVKDPAGRWRSAREMAAAVRAARGVTTALARTLPSGHDGASARSLDPVHRASDPPSVRRHRALALGVGAVLTLAGAILGASRWADRVVPATSEPPRTRPAATTRDRAPLPATAAPAAPTTADTLPAPLVATPDATPAPGAEVRRETSAGARRHGARRRPPRVTAEARSSGPVISHQMD